MMPFYYGSKVRSVPEFMNRRFGPTAHLVNALSFALAQLLIAGINLYLLAKIVEVLLGWPLWVALLVADAVVLTYTALGGLSAAIYNEVLQFFVIVAALLPLTLLGLHKVGWLQRPHSRDQQDVRRLAAAELVAGHQPDRDRQPVPLGRRHRVRSRVRAGLGYWTTNFVEVQRAMASSSMSAAQRAPIIGTFPKMFIPFIVILPGMIAGVLVSELSSRRRARRRTTTTRSST